MMRECCIYELVGADRSNLLSTSCPNCGQEYKKDTKKQKWEKIPKNKQKQ